MTDSLDHSRLAELLRGSDQPLAAFLASFRRSFDADVALLLDAAADGDFVRIGQLAHRIEGAARVIGARHAALACDVIAKACDPAMLRMAIAAFIESRDMLYACLDTLMPAGSAPGGGEQGAQICDGLVFLVVEDHAFQRGVIVHLLRRLGALEVHAFPDGASGLAGALELRSPAIMVLDLAMPGLNGIEVMQDGGLEKLPLAVIVNSALGPDLLGWPLHTARSRGVNVLGAVSKPLTAAKLAPLLAQHRHDQARRRPRLGAGTSENPATLPESVKT